MCGISGIYRYTNITDNDTEKLGEMNREMKYRGPDGNDVWHDEKCGLAHTRLSIIGIENGAQPLWNEDKTLVLVCNGEIYNYVELKEELEAKGHNFSTKSDSETILHLYEEYGVNCIKKLRGMFAFLIWDTKVQKLFVARDRMGEKPMYFCDIPSGIVFSSELKAIRKNWICTPKINDSVLAECIRYNYPLDLRNTWIRQIKRIEAGEYAIIDKDGIEINRYWNIEGRKEEAIVKKEEAMKKTLSLLKESIDITLRSDVPVAVLLSGGIDSTTIAALAKETGREVHVISAGYKGHHGEDEREVAKRFAKDKGLIYHEVELDVKDFKELFEEYIHYIDEPICDVASMAQWALYKKAKEMGFKVLLSGLGGDELFFGYPYHNKIAESLRLRRELHNLSPLKTWDKKKAYIRWVRKNWRWLITGGSNIIKLDDKIPVDWTFDDYWKCINNGKWKEAYKNVHFSYPETATIDTVYEFLRTRFMNTLCLYLADRLGMGNSLEIRCPLLDHKLWEYVKTLPLDIVYDGRPKGFMRDMLTDILPEYILKAEKRGFTPPFGFIREMANEYNYRFLDSQYVFFNSMLADNMVSTLNKAN